MSSFKHKLAFLIPTKDRPNDLTRLLTSVQNQSYQPNEIIIIDGGYKPVDHLLNDFHALNLRYVREFPPSLTRQRNVGIRALSSSMTLVGFLDDDVVFEEGALESMYLFWENAPDSLGGAAFNIVGDGHSQLSFLRPLRWLFLTASKEDGVVFRSGYETMARSPDENKYTQFLSGAASVWRRGIFDQYKFDEWFTGYGLGEDLEFSYRVGKAYKLAVVAEARVQHLTSPPEQRDNYKFGVMEIINRMYIVKKNPELSVALCYWANFWRLLENIFRFLIGFRRSYLLRAVGNLAGFLRVLLDKPNHR